MTNDEQPTPEPMAWELAQDQLRRRWPIYAAVTMEIAAGGFAVDFAITSREWAALPVALAWTLLAGWYWLYSVGFRYGRPLLKFFALAVGIALGGVLTAVCLDRAPAQLAATADGSAERGAVGALYWAGFVTAGSALTIFLHALLVGTGRFTLEEADEEAGETAEQPPGDGESAANPPVANETNDETTDDAPAEELS